MAHTARYELEQPASRSGAVLSLVVLLPAASSVFVPIGLALSDVAAVRHALDIQPGAALQIAFGLALWSLLVVVPVGRRLMQVGLSRSAIIADGRVTEVTRTVFSEQRVEQPLQAFDGIVHRVRTSVDGVTHELALIDATRGHDVVFQQAPVITRDAVESALRQLALPEIRANDLIRMPSWRDVIGMGSSPRTAPA